MHSYSNPAIASFQHNEYSSISAIDPLQRPPKLEPNIIVYAVLSVQYSIYMCV